MITSLSFLTKETTNLEAPEPNYIFMANSNSIKTESSFFLSLTTRSPANTAREMMAFWRISNMQLHYYSDNAFFMARVQWLVYGRTGFCGLFYGFFEVLHQRHNGCWTGVFSAFFIIIGNVTSPRTLISVGWLVCQCSIISSKVGKLHYRALIGALYIFL